MEKDVLVILMVAFGLFAIIMFVLFFVYLKKYYNSRHLDDDYKKESEPKIDDDETDSKEEKVSLDEDMEFVPIKKK